MPDLTIRIKKKKDGSAALTCIRADGSTSWQQQNGPSGAFFPLQDLTHYAVETVMFHRRGFYGLMAEGWDFSDFGAPWPKGSLPADADPAELIVGFMDAERATGSEWTAAELAKMAADFLGVTEIPPSIKLPSDSELDQIREVRRDLFARWNAVQPGGALELEF